MDQRGGSTPHEVFRFIDMNRYGSVSDDKPHCTLKTAYVFMNFEHQKRRVQFRENQEYEIDHIPERLWIRIFKTSDIHSSILNK